MEVKVNYLISKTKNIEVDDKFEELNKYEFDESNLTDEEISDLRQELLSVVEEQIYQTITEEYGYDWSEWDVAEVEHTNGQELIYNVPFGEF